RPAGAFSVTFPGVVLPGGSFVTATATDPDGNTSEFAQNLVVGNLVVTNMNATGPGSLRAAADAANLLPGPDRITFAIPADDPGHFYYRDDGVANQVTHANRTPTTAAADDLLIDDIDPDWRHSWWTIAQTQLLTFTAAGGP